MHMQTQPSNASQLPLEYPQALFPSRLAWLCQPEQIEHTLLLLFYLNGWKKANQQLLYADRQGLQAVQALVLEQAVKTGAMQAIGYMDGTDRFPGELLLESAASNAARGVLITVRDLCNPDIWPHFYPDGTETYKRFIRPLYRRISGKDCKLVADALGLLRFEQIRDHIEERLQRLVEQAKVTRRPLPLRRLACLCIAPIDLLHIRDNRLYFLDDYTTWDDLDVCDLRKLDPEGFSKVVFQYSSPTAEYLFHLPFDRAIQFMPAGCIYELERAPAAGQERGSAQGQPIDEAAGLEYPVKTILQDLGVDIAAVCPHKLLEKETYLAHPAIRDLLWPTRGLDQDGWDDDPWNGVCLPPDQALIPM
jgi:hypothetical protein